MPLPRAVQEQAERADALMAQLYGNTAPPAPEGQTDETLTLAPAPAEETPAPVVEAPPAPPAPEPAAPAADSWELKYQALDVKHRVLEGKYRAEVPRLSQRVKELEAENAQLKAVAPSDQTSNSLTPQSVREQYGDDFAAAVEAVVEARVKPVGDELNSVKAENAQFARQTFYSELSALVPNFAAIDQEPGFTAFLDDLDPMSGRTRREFFNEADAGNNAARIASFFQNYLRTKAPATAPTPVPPTPSADHLIAPDSSRAAAAPAGKTFWSPSKVRAFYAAARRGQYTEAEYAAIDNDISRAPGEGRMLAQ